VVETSRRQDIDDAASTLFRERGYAGTSVRDIARALDIQGASLYAHVTSKEDLLWSIVERTATRFEAAADAAVNGQAWQGADPGGRLGAIVRAHVDVVTEDIGRASVFVHEWRALTGDRRTRIAARRDAYELRFRAAIADGLNAGAFVPVDPVVTTAAILSALNGIATWYRPDGRVGPADLATTFADLARRAVGDQELKPGEAR
jgi:AcrR family transcriptional regulator